MQNLIEKDNAAKKPLKFVKAIYILAAFLLGISGLIHHDLYKGLLGMATLLLIPGIWAVRKLFHIKGGWQMEIFVYLFSLLGWTMGGAASVYGLLPGFDKLVHCLSGVFVSMLALSLYQMLERNRTENPATACCFTFFASMAVAGMFELCEFALAPIMGRDLQHVLDTGVGDTMGDIFVCMLGTIVYVLLMIRCYHGKRNFLVDSALALVAQNPKTN